MNEISFFERFQNVISHLGWTQKRFSEESGISQKTISSWSKKNVTPSMRSIRKIADVTHCHPAYLQGENVMMFESEYAGKSSPNIQYSTNGISFERHCEVAAELKNISSKLRQLNIEFGRAYKPDDQLLSRPVKFLSKTIDDLERVKDFAEENLFKEHPEKASVKVYYGHDIKPPQKNHINIQEEKRKRDRGRRETDKLSEDAKYFAFLLDKLPKSERYKIGAEIVKASESTKNLKKISGES